MSRAFLSGHRFIRTEWEFYDLDGDVPAGGTEGSTYSADDGELWEIIGVQFRTEELPNATEGEHSFRMTRRSNTTSTFESFFGVVSNYDTRIRFLHNELRDGEIEYSDMDEQTLYSYLAGGIFTMTDDFGIGISYNNNTDGVQEAERNIALLVNKYQA